jgi:hypothetical protein
MWLYFLSLTCLFVLVGVFNHEEEVLTLVIPSAVFFLYVAALNFYRKVNAFQLTLSFAVALFSELLFYFANGYKPPKFTKLRVEVTDIRSSRRPSAVYYGLANMNFSAWVHEKKIYTGQKINVGDCFIVEIEEKIFSKNVLRAVSCD